MLSLGFSFLLRGKDSKRLRGLCLLYFFIFKGAVQNEKLVFVHMKSIYFPSYDLPESFFVLDEARMNNVIWPDVSFGVHTFPAVTFHDRAVTVTRCLSLYFFILFNKRFCLSARLKCTIQFEMDGR